MLLKPRINSKRDGYFCYNGFYEFLMDVIKRKNQIISRSHLMGGSDLRNDLFPLTKQIVTLLEAIKIAVPYIQELLRLCTFL
jgi:hypothetical protein